MAPSSELAVVLNTSGRAIWDLCDGRHPIADILGTLRNRYDAQSEILLADLGATLDELARAGLITFDTTT
jgi:hypothetical protein